ncbi:MAG: DinB family protein [Candidatus Thorarchaeota archaeon]
MVNADIFRDLANHTRKWRDRVLKQTFECGCTDLSFRPSTGMASLGWLIAHQAAVFDFSLSVLIKNEEPLNPDLFWKYVPGTPGDWDGVTTLEAMHEYYDSSEKALFEWLENAEPSDMSRVHDGERVPKFFAGMTIQEAICNLFVHMNYHNGHLESLRRDWLRQKSIDI